MICIVTIYVDLHTTPSWIYWVIKIIQSAGYLCLCCVVGVGVLAMLIVSVFLDNIDREQTSQFRGNREPFCHTFLATFRLLKDWRLLTLIPLTMYSGFEQSFLSGEYTKVRASTTVTDAHILWMYIEEYLEPCQIK